ncbi:lytic transglycosylase domain-containing protein [Phreatobacter aquaticus]|uniref:Lytic transglycosylase domain-containing protein n=1 Tax=Phreatobacter aquaticus TaxID=2570229 RepID=A0A4D7QI49_9HYPH|nr:transglycosylase SLT domain-containing protein [Phreatobacter aquaticus]QCK87068.1 lytic transglycosylase domain-containing protein [Phreatobacter aquaticus]
MNRVLGAIQTAAEKTGASFSYLLRTAQRESSLQPAAQASTSSARGLYQFIDSTWLTMMRDEGRNLGLSAVASQIGSNASGQPVVADASTRQQILALRDDPQVAALMAGALTNRNAQSLRSATGRDPTEGELYMAHFLGSAGAARLISLNETNPQGTAARAFPEAASANRRIFFDQGRPRTVSEVYSVLAGGQSSTVAASSGTTQTPATSGQAATTATTAARSAVQTDPDPGSWSPVARINADPNKPFHSMFSGNGGPINAFVAATWASLGRSNAQQPSVAVPTALSSSQTSASTTSTASLGGASSIGTAASIANATTATAVGGPYLPVRVYQQARSTPLDLSQFLRAQSSR